MTVTTSSQPSDAQTAVVAADDFKAAMRQLSAAVNIITTVQDGQRRGLTATAVCSLCAEPPRILCCVNRSSENNAAIRAAGIFAINVLPATQVELSSDFAGRLTGEDRFGTAEWTTLATGSPVLVGAIAVFDCKLVETVESGTHTIFIGEVLAASSEKAAPLLYGDRAYGTLSPLVA